MQWSERTWAELPHDLLAAAQGRIWLEWMVEDLTALIARGMVEMPPLDRSYFEITN
jgi:hypothetical protein